MAVYKSEFSLLFWNYNYSSVSLMVGYVAIFLLNILFGFQLYKDGEISSILRYGCFSMCFYILLIVFSWNYAYRRIVKLTIDVDKSMFVVSPGAPFAPKKYLLFSDVHAVSCDEIIQSKFGGISWGVNMKTTIYGSEGIEWFSFYDFQYSNYHYLVNIIKHEVIEKNKVKQI